MKLEVLKPLEYISYTSLSQWEACQHSFYQQRLSGLTLPGIEQTPQMAVGNAFDSFIKAEISRRIHKGDDAVLFAKLIQTMDNKHASLIPIGKNTYEAYVKTGFLDNLLREGLDNVEIDKKVTLPNGVRVYIKPDAVKGDIPHDWKTSGYGATRNYSPKPGYDLYISPYGDVKTGDPMYMEHVNEDWAKQLCLYYWGLTEDVTPRKFNGSIDLILYTPKGLSYARYRNPISVGFQEGYLKVLENCWRACQEGEFEPPIPNKFKCEPYHNPRPCTLTCKAYEEMLADPVMRGIYG